MILGSDNSAQMATWYNPNGILELCTVVAGSRLPAAAQVDSALAEKMVAVDTPVIEVSSTRIRRRLSQGLPIRCMVPRRSRVTSRRKVCTDGDEEVSHSSGMRPHRERYDAYELRNLSQVGAPLLARYDLEAAAASMKKTIWSADAPTCGAILKYCRSRRKAR